ncbi:hypothetical protein ACGFXB_04600 [Streptomyces canus]|uniref:hypothetical protein n=1 Tax=Streptomyces canus TaxID=58343 RepID=UPI003716FB6C
MDNPLRLSALVSSRDEQRALGENEVRALARAAVESPAGPPFPAYGLDPRAPLPLVGLFTGPVCGNWVRR